MNIENEIKEILRKFFSEDVTVYTFYRDNIMIAFENYIAIEKKVLDAINSFMQKRNYELYKIYYNAYEEKICFEYKKSDA